MKLILRSERIAGVSAALLFGLVSLAMATPCAAQMRADSDRSEKPQNAKEAGATASGVPSSSGEATPAAASADPTAANPDPNQATSKAGTPSGTSGLAGRFGSFTRNAPTRESWGTFELGSKYVKGVFGGFEQGAVLGLGLQFTTADAIRAVEFRATLLTSPLLYRRFEGEAYVPKIFDEHTHADLWFDYLRRTKDDFFGIGSTFPKTFHTNFDLEQRSYNGSLFRDFTPHIQAGVYASVANTATYRGQRTRDIPIDFLFSSDPNAFPPTQFAPGLLTNTKILSYGAFADYDLRDNSAGLTKGAYFYGRIGSSQALKDKTAFADYGWLEGELDARGYIPLGSNKTSLAVRGYAVLKGPRGNSQIPFYDLAFLGGRTYGRGFFNYRFRADNLALFSAELRQTIWAQKEDRGLDVFGFGDAGQVWGDNRSVIDPAILANSGFDSRNWRAGIGGGFQYRYSSKLAGRIEVGHSNERTLIYASLSRGF